MEMQITVFEPGWFVPGNERNARNPLQLSGACFEDIYLILHFLSKKENKRKRLGVTSVLLMLTELLRSQENHLLFVTVSRSTSLFYFFPRLCCLLSSSLPFRLPFLLGADRVPRHEQRGHAATSRPRSWPARCGRRHGAGSGSSADLGQRCQRASEALPTPLR